MWYISQAVVSTTNRICESGGIGRRARLRGVWGSSYGFKSRLSHQENDRFQQKLVVFSFIRLTASFIALQFYCALHSVICFASLSANKI